MGTFSRLRYVVAANVNALIEKAEDPEKLLRALIREMEDAGDEARAASAELLAEQQRLNRLEAGLADELISWQRRAEDAVAAGRDDLARAALKARVEIEMQQRATADERGRVTGRVAQMEEDMATLKSKLAEAKTRLKGMYSGKAPRPGPSAGAERAPRASARASARSAGPSSASTACNRRWTISRHGCAPTTSAVPPRQSGTSRPPRPPTPPSRLSWSA
jgi:chromosome segregation ATPase